MSTQTVPKGATHRYECVIVIIKVKQGPKYKILGTKI
jgi:hypothetical protein